jgi:hypothetical protein
MYYIDPYLIRHHLLWKNYWQIPSFYLPQVQFYVKLDIQCGSLRDLIVFRVNVEHASQFTAFHTRKDANDWNDFKINKFNDAAWISKLCHICTAWLCICTMYLHLAYMWLLYSHYIVCEQYREERPVMTRVHILQKVESTMYTQKLPVNPQATKGWWKSSWTN